MKKILKYLTWLTTLMLLIVFSMHPKKSCNTHLSKTVSDITDSGFLERFTNVWGKPEPDSHLALKTCHRHCIQAKPAESNPFQVSLVICVSVDEVLIWSSSTECLNAFYF